MKEKASCTIVGPATTRKMCVISLARRAVIDVLSPDGKVTVFGGENIETVLERNPDAQIVPDFEAVRRVEECFITDPVRICAERFNEMLNALPPLEGGRIRGGHYFKMSEFTYASVTGVFVYFENRYYEFADRVALSPCEIHEKVVAAVRSQTEIESA